MDSLSIRLIPSLNVTPQPPEFRLGQKIDLIAKAWG